jgi:hypothetical protein
MNWLKDDLKEVCQYTFEGMAFEAALNRLTGTPALRSLYYVTHCVETSRVRETSKSKLGVVEGCSQPCPEVSRIFII